MSKIAFIKEACLGDLWVGDNNDTYSDLIRSSLQMVGPIALLEEYGSDFFIVQTNNSKAGQKIRFCQQRHISNEDYKLVENTKIKINSSRLPFRCPNDFSHDPEKINWSKYDIVISHDFAVPISIRRQHPSILWICLTQEGKYPVQSSCWDYFISHDYPNTPVAELKILSMPYCFVPPKYIYDNFKTSQNKRGIFVEINSSRIVKSNQLNNQALFKKFSLLNLNVEFHSENIEKNLNKLSSSKYFIKLKGRTVRGNSFLEAMSARSLCLLGHNDCYGRIPFHQYCYFKDEEHLIEKLQFLEKNNDFLNELLNYQDLVLQNMVENVKIQFEIALSKKRKYLESKSSRVNSKKISIKSILKKSLQPIMGSACYNCIVRLNDPVIDPIIYLPSILE